jgi:crossover junction endodeoxyribonuclease RuvC
MFDTRVLGVDPGVARLGLAVVASEGRRSTLVWCDTVRTSSELTEASRLRLVADAMRAAIAAHRPTAVALERVAFNRNTVSALTVARATGAVMVVAAEAGLEVAEFSPSEVKSAVTGIGNADKRQVRAALARVHGLRDVPAQPDAADAAAVAVTFLAGAGLRAAGSRATARLGAP